MAVSPEKFTGTIIMKHPCVSEVQRILKAQAEHPERVSVIYLSPSKEPGKPSTVCWIDPATGVENNFQSSEFVSSDKGSLCKLPGDIVVSSRE